MVEDGGGWWRMVEDGGGVLGETIAMRVTQPPPTFTVLDHPVTSLTDLTPGPGYRLTGQLLTGLAPRHSRRQTAVNMRHSFRGALVVAALVGVAACSDLTQPEGLTDLDVAQDLALSSGDAAVGDVLD